MTSILVVDDELVFIEALTISLEREGFGVIAAADGPAALKAISEKDPDLILLDVMLPGMSGIDVCREIRKSSSVPVIMVTAKGEEIDAVVGLEVGADDYITKPYRLRELIARIRDILRRSEHSPKEDETTSNSEVLVEGAVRLDLERHELSVDGELVSLALREFELLSYLMENSGRVVTRESLMQNVWGWDYICLLYTSPSPRDLSTSRMPSSA